MHWECLFMEADKYVDSKDSEFSFPLLFKS